jgi:enoyl-CoA hydratase/carnithine racemase
VTDDVTTVVDALTAGIALGGPIAVAATKRLLRRAFDRDADRRAADFEAARQLSESLFVSEEAREGMAAFAEKRRPAWQGP